MAKAAFNKKRALFTGKMDLELRKKVVKCYIWSIALHGAETGIVCGVDQKQLESFEMCCWRRMEKIGWTDRVRNEEVVNTRVHVMLFVTWVHVHERVCSKLCFPQILTMTINFSELRRLVAIIFLQGPGFDPGPPVCDLW
jgi:hypothetical protein